MPGGSFDPLAPLVGQPLSSVEFVQDYVQLRFDGPCLTALVWPVVHAGGVAHRGGAPGYRDALCARIARTVTAAVAGDAELALAFDDGARLTLSVRAEDRRGPEAVVLSDVPGAPTVVW